MSRSLTWRLVAFVAATVYAWGLQYCYARHLSVIVGAGFNNFEPGLALAAGAVALAVAPLLWFPRDERVSTVMLWLIYLVVYIPACVIPVYSLQYPLEGYVEYAAVLFLCVLLAARICKARTLRLNVTTLDLAGFITLICMLAVGGTALVVLTAGVNWQVFSGLNILYDIREQHEAAFASSPLAGYAVSILGYALLPFLMAWGLVRRRVLLVVLAASCLVAMFAASAQP